MREQEEHLKILINMFTGANDYPFDGDEEVKDIETMAKKVLSEAESLYSEENYYREYPEFKDFLYGYQVDSIAYDVYNGEYN